jgi:hypothetical protein
MRSIKNLFLQNKGSVFIIALNVIIILTVFLFSFSFTSLMRYHLLDGEAKRYQAYLNARSGMELALKEWKSGKIQIPFKKTFILFDDTNYQAEVSLEYAVFEKKEGKIEIRPSSGGEIKITSIGKYVRINWQIMAFFKGKKQIFYYSQ